MGLTKPPKKDKDAADSFISGAPDSQTSQDDVVKEKRRAISITVDPDLLDRLDAAAKQRGITRSAAFAVAVSSWLGVDKP